MGDKVMRDAMDRASAMGDHAFKDGMEKSLAALNELNAQSKRNLEAVVESVTAATKGAESLSNEAMAYTKKAVEGQVEQAKALSGARSVAGSGGTPDQLRQDGHGSLHCADEQGPPRSCPAWSRKASGP